MTQLKLHLAHWGTFLCGWNDGQLKVQPDPLDPDPNQIIFNLPSAIHHRARISQPMVRRGWLEHGPGPDPNRGQDSFVPLTWDRALDLLAAELQRVTNAYGPESIFGGSYGWASAGRFHHAQSQLHRFLNTALGGYVRSVNNYSAGASLVILPHVLGSMEEVARRNVSWNQVARDSEVVLAFGGMALKNSRVAAGGVSRHVERGAMQQAAARGCRFICVSPMKDDLPTEAKSEWVSIKPGTDTALMLGLVHTLVQRSLHDRPFLTEYCEGWSEFEPYLQGTLDGQPKDAQWAQLITGVPAERIVELALSLHARRVLVVVAHSLQRAEHGEQPVWMAVVLAAVLGQIGLPGGGYAYALGTLAHYGRRTNMVGPAAFPQGSNPVRSFIPVARITDMLLHPGTPFHYNGQQHVYPHVRLAYWAGGNPFHHHQDLNRLAAGIRRLDTFVVQDAAWTASAKHADFVLPCTLTVERDDLGGTPIDPLLVAMRKVVPPFQHARDDYDIFCELARRLGSLEEFSEGRSAEQWIRHCWRRPKTEPLMRVVPTQN